MKIKYKYIGKGAFIHGVRIPAKDLTESEFDAFTDDEKASILASGLYEEVAEPKPPKKKEIKDG
jgi:hypothetical protein